MSGPTQIDVTVQWNPPRDGGPAFPVKVPGDLPPDATPGKLYAVPDVQTFGMSLRDYFAAQSIALAALNALARIMNDGKSPGDATIAQEAYALADAMLAERAK